MAEQPNDYVMQGNEADALMARRRAEGEAKFLLPHLKPGMSLVDCGCGQGTITLGLAQVVAPGNVVGFDTQTDHIARAAALAREHQATNVSFRVGDIYDPPVDAGGFDAAFIHAVLVHLSDPLAGLSAVRRLLKPGGVVGVVDAAGPGVSVGPGSQHYSDFLRWLHLAIQKSTNNPYTREDPYMGRSLKRVLRDAGFSRIDAEASALPFRQSLEVARMAVSPTAAPVVRILEQGIVSKAEMRAAQAGISEWVRHPDAFASGVFITAIAFND